MSIAARRAPVWDNGYPTSDGKPLAETDTHRRLTIDLIQTLRHWYANDPNVYVSGNLLLFYEEGDRRRHVSPDVFVVKGVPNHPRPNYLLWEEGKGPDVVIELTSSSTRGEDLGRKLDLYRDTPRVREYFLFDPFGDWLDPPLQGYRLWAGEYQRVHGIDGRLPSQVLKLHLERDGNQLRLYDPTTGSWLPTPDEEIARMRRELGSERTARERAEAEVERLRAELDRLRRSRN
ncbi:MAG TPA: Uma2 family endonuclease [Gemmataceae bacterium]